MHRSTRGWWRVRSVWTSPLAHVLLHAGLTRGAVLTAFRAPREVASPTETRSEFYGAGAAPPGPCTAPRRVGPGFVGAAPGDESWDPRKPNHDRSFEGDGSTGPQHRFEDSLRLVPCCMGLVVGSSGGLDTAPGIMYCFTQG